MVVDDENVILDSIRDYFDAYSIVTHSDPRDALDSMRQKPSDILVCDFRMPGLSGLDLLRAAKSIGAYRYGILMTAYADKEVLLASIQERLVDRVIEKPLRMDELGASLQEALSRCAGEDLRKVEIEEAKRHYRESVRGGAALSEDIIGLDGGLAEVYGIVSLAAATKEGMLFAGETGTGKEVLARLAHSLSPRSGGPFVKINCGALPEHLIESELFGHAKGAFTGAEAEKPGKIELAEGGTLFLDEIGELRGDLQTRLLKVLQDRIVDRLGSTRGRKIDFRLMCATNRNLESEIAAGRFREDLFYRISTIRVTVPPLRERGDDLFALARSIVDSYCAELGRRSLSFPTEALARISAYAWPGNVRELENVLKRAVILTGQRAEELPSSAFDCLGREGSQAARAAGPGGAVPDLSPAVERLCSGLLAGELSLAGIEERLLDALLERCGGNVLRAASRSGIAKDRLYRHLRRREAASEKGRSAP